MGRIFDDASQTIGNTPLIRIRKIPRGLSESVADKIEGRNPVHSVTCRVGAVLPDSGERYSSTALFDGWAA